MAGYAPSRNCGISACVTIEVVVLRGDADVGREPPHEADVAQAHLFATALHAEVAELQLRIEEVERWRRQRQRRKRSSDLDPPERLLRLRNELLAERVGGSDQDPERLA
jgi:hypothetical protein